MASRAARAHGPSLPPAERLPSPAGPGPPAGEGRRWGTWWARRPALAAAAIYAVCALVFVGPGLLPGHTLSSSDYLWSSAPWTAQRPPGVRLGGTNFEMADTVVYFQPSLQYTRRSLPGIPLWNPYEMGGRPFLANAQSAIFSPFSLPAYLLPFWFSLGVSAALKLFTAAFGTYLLARALGMRFGGGLLSGMVFAFGLYMVVWLAWPNASVWALIPWLLWLAERLVQRPSPRALAALAVTVALQYFAGHPESSFHALAATVIFLGFRLVPRWQQGGRRMRSLARPAGMFAGALVLGSALAAVTLLPFAELLAHSSDFSNRAGQPPAQADPSGLSSLFFPDRWGRPTHFELRLFLINRAYFVGALTLMLAGAALLLRPSRRRLWTAAGAVLALVTAFGVPPLFWLLTRLPLIRSVREDRLVILFLLGLALLAGWGLDELSRRGARPARRWPVLTLAGAVAVVPPLWLIARNGIRLSDLGSALRVAWGFAGAPLGPGGQPTGDTSSVLALAPLLEWMPLALAGAALLTFRLRSRRPLSPALFGALAVGFVVLELFRAGMGYNPAIPISHAKQPTTGAIRYLQSQRPARFVGLDPAGSDLTPLNGDVAMRYGLYDARGYDYPVITRYDRLWRRTIFNNPFLPATTRATATPGALRGLDLLSVADLVQDPGDRPLAPTAGLRLAYDGADARVYTNDRALPRVFVVQRQRVLSGDGAQLAAVTAPTFPARRVAITAAPVPGLGQTSAGPGIGGVDRARLVSYGPQRVVADATARRGGMLVLTDVYYPGWTASVDGRPATVRRVDYLLRGVVVPPGPHRVTFTYEPVSFTVGWVVSLLALLAIALIAAVGGRRPRLMTAAVPTS